MGIAGFGRSKIRYDMFDLVRSEREAKRLAKCENIYHRGQHLAWNGKEILDELLERNGGIHVNPREREALKRVFAIILWGELAAWRISTQLADGLVPLEAKMAATSQAHDEARHFYVMHDYLTVLGYSPKRLDRAPQALLDLVLDTPNLAYKLLGMQLMIETLALTIFQTVREMKVEPVLTELMKYYERDEARHVGLGMQYLPSLMKDMNRREVTTMITFQCRLLFWALYELKTLEPDFAVLGIDARSVLERGRRKQLVALHAAFDALGIPFDRDRNLVVMLLNSSVELLFPDDQTRAGGLRYKAGVAWKAFWRAGERAPDGELDVHGQHEIRTARGKVATADAVGA
jgi:hypothetical protein